MDISGFSWMNESSARWEGEWFVITAPAMTDFFRDPSGAVVNLNAPFLCTPVTGDFTLRARVRHAFRSVYDACTLMVWDGPETWAKVCFEATDFGTHAAVSVVTRGVSDDANGVDLSSDEIWLQLCRRGGTFACHYSEDGKNWRMIRYYGLRTGDTVRVGLVGQSPAGPGAELAFSNIELLPAAPENMRAGV